MEKIEARCMKCKENKIMENVVATVTKNNRNAVKGTCPVCGTKMFKFVKK